MVVPYTIDISDERLATIASWMAYKQPDALLGFHINMVSVLAEDVTPTTPEEKDFISRRAVILDRVQP